MVKKMKFWTYVQIRSTIRTLYPNKDKKKFGQLNKEYQEAGNCAFFLMVFGHFEMVSSKIPRSFTYVSNFR